MTYLIKITDQNTVSARELHEFLGIETRFSDWIKRQFDFIEAVEGENYVLLKNEKGISLRNSRTEYFLTIETAKEISILQRTDKGKEARRYFIECEKKLKDIYSKYNIEQLLKDHEEEMALLKEHLKKTSFILRQYMRTLYNKEDCEILSDRLRLYTSGYWDKEKVIARRDKRLEERRKEISSNNDNTEVN